MYVISQLRANGVSASTIARIRRDNDRLSRGVYCAPQTSSAERYSYLCTAVLDRMTDTAFLGGPAAATAWGLPLLTPPQNVHVHGVRRGRYSSQVSVLAGLAQSTTLAGVPLATPAWTVAECARVLSARDAAVVADAALNRGLCTLAELQTVCDQLRGKHAVGRVRWVIANADPLSESPGETWLRLILRSLGYEVRSQVEVRRPTGLARIDLLIADSRIAIEFDGLQKYTSREAVAQEKLRQADLEALGYLVLRVVWAQLLVPEMIDKRLRSVGAVPVHPRHDLPF